MTESILAQEATLRLTVFLAVLVAMALWEVAAPRRRQDIPRVIRWTNNLALVVVDTVILRLTFPILAVGLALMAEERGWGLFNALDVPLWLAVLLSILLLDLAIYLQHVLFHAVPGLWRLHRMHHADLEFDVTTGLRFHPVEIVLSMVIKLAVVAALGAPAVAVLLFEVLLNATAMFNHANIRLPAGRRPGAAVGHGDARHAPRPPFGDPGRDQQQFRLQPAVVGPAAGHLPGATEGRARGHDHRHRAVPHAP